MAYKKTDPMPEPDSEPTENKRFEKQRAKPSTWQAAEISKFVLEHDTERSAQRFVAVLLEIADGLARAHRLLEEK